MAKLIKWLRRNDAGALLLKQRNVIDAGWRAAWDAIVTAMHSDISLFNTNSPADRAVHIRSDGHGAASFSASRTNDKGISVALDVSADRAGLRVRRTVTANFGPQHIDDRAFAFVAVGVSDVGVRAAGGEIYAPSMASGLVLKGLL